MPWSTHHCDAMPECYNIDYDLIKGSAHFGLGTLYHNKPQLLCLEIPRLKVCPWCELKFAEAQD